ncbi:MULTISPECIES: GNAT family N-acetyltransferase [Pseudoalteromonas]|uniref:GNAT family N-acetyltransferase n=1 Tax=Pseudoalteromonas TaxID=53246 RepID=UPI000FFF4714|nr:MULTISPECIES: GNAT family N-acetyltransferase [Pseudoalteromonas]MDW7547320.1 GNAT family N-acetyltransferase [Pseudoalteromonas peptidolytica]RXF04751.1 GNAT family N-acetyltransferase [Pseudoalteromonas sp. PS5]
MITIRQFQCGEEAVLRKLMFDTIRSVTIKHYSDNQVKAWAHSDIADESWQDRLRSNQPLVAVLNGKIVGFADIQANGLIDHFFCHAEHQGQGIGKALMLALLEHSRTTNITRLFSHVSKTAKPFFERFGFDVIKEQQVNVRGEVLTNYLMERVMPTR